MPQSPTDYGPAHASWPTTLSALSTSSYSEFPTLEECQGIGHHVSQLVAANHAFAAELIDCLLDVNHADLQHLHRGYSSQCWADVRAYAHRIKSTAQLSGAMTVVGLCQRVESMVDQGDVENLLATAGLFQISVQRLSEALAAWAGWHDAQVS